MPRASQSDGPVSLQWPGKSRGDASVSTIALRPWERFGPQPVNRLYHADNADVLRALRADRTRPMLIFIDPPYAMQAVHGVRVEGGIDAVAYADAWSEVGYCQFMYERLALMHDVLDEAGFLFVHCDWRASAWLRVMLDELFGRGCFRNEIVWRRAPNLGRQARGNQLGRCVDSILVFSKSPGSPFRGEAPMKSTPVPLTRTGTPRGARWDEARQAWFTLAPRGDYTDASMRELERQGRAHTSPSGTRYVKYFLRTAPDGEIYKDAPLDTLWDDDGVLPLRHASKRELAIRYVTQKPESLLDRIIRWATRPGDLVADFFTGSGTTLAVAEKLGRPWLGADRGDLAIHTIRKRLLALDASFEVLTDGTTSHGVAAACRVSEQVRLDSVSWPAPIRPATALRVTRGKRTEAGQPRGTPPTAVTPRPDLIVAQPASPCDAPSVVLNAEDAPLDPSLPWTLHVYDAAGRCALAHVSTQEPTSGRVKRNAASPQRASSGRL
ncbi:MAG TPA: site-specific DNA-methyltransferase [Phycisphaerales bacterium]|nr:site-specific DNA-methyltransferase [Phycisphaerales bacterium]